MKFIYKPIVTYDGSEYKKSQSPGEMLPDRHTVSHSCSGFENRTLRAGGTWGRPDVSELLLSLVWAREGASRSRVTHSCCHLVSWGLF